jgi:putative ABC transport system substrate-binding protein
MKRRRVLALLGGAILGWPRVTRAQQADGIRRLGLLLPYVQSDPQAQARVSAFTAALQERGWTDGRNVRLEFRYTQGQPARLPALAAELVQSKVDVILTAGTESTDAARSAGCALPLRVAGLQARSSTARVREGEGPAHRCGRLACGVPGTDE